MRLELVEQGIAELNDGIRLALRSTHRTMAMVNVSIRRVVAAGRMLRRYRSQVGDGEWGDWLEANVSGEFDFTRETARKWMKLSEFAELRGQDLETAQSITQAYRLAGLLPEGEAAGGGGGPSKERVVLNGLTRLAEDLKGMAIERMGREDRIILRQRLEPYVALYEKLLDL